MSICRFCGQKTSWFKDVHPACIASSQAGCEQIASIVAASAVEQVVPSDSNVSEPNWCTRLTKQVWSEVKPKLDQICSERHVPSDESDKALLQGWSAGAERVAFAAPVSASRFEALSCFYRTMGLSDEVVKKTYGHLAMCCSLRLWFVMEHGDPTPVASQQGHPFNLKTGEIPLIVFGNVVYFKETVTRSYQGSHAGMSVRIAKGVYYHAGGFTGRSIESLTLKKIDSGKMLLTTQSIYFGGDHANFRIPYERVVSFRPYSNGIGVFRDSVSAKPELFSVFEVGQDGALVQARPVFGWLIFNLAHFLAQPEARMIYAAKSARKHNVPTRKPENRLKSS